MRRAAARWGAVVGLVVAATPALAPRADASCAGPPDGSPHAFVGTVVGTRAGDRIATVVTDEGTTVTVVGAEDTGWFSEPVSSTDRRFAVGGRYEFHPTNASDPYRDHACTATTRIAGPGLEPLEPDPQYLPDWLPVDEQAGPVGYLLLLGPVAVAALGTVCLAGWARRRRSGQPG